MIRFPSKLSQRQAQHTLEYSILILMIMVGIIITGPYVMRSWNARVKGWEDSVYDSMQDPLLNAPYGQINAALPNDGT